MGNRTASADPARLEAAAQAVPEELRAELIDGHQRLEDLLETFSSSTQPPDRIFINPDYITGWMARAYGRGTELDERLIRVAGAFRTAAVALRASSGKAESPEARAPPGDRGRVGLGGDVCGESGAGLMEWR